MTFCHPFKSYSIGLTALLFCLTWSAASAAGLNNVDRTLAANLATTITWEQNRSAVVPGDHRLGVQTLSVEYDEQKKGQQSKRARVYQFNYNKQQSRLVLVNLITGVVEKVRPIDTVHLPLNSQEIANARQLVEANAELMSQLNTEQIRRTGSTLPNLNELDVKASIFEPESASHVCAAERCALLSLFDKTHTVYSLEPLVNLQRLSVTTLQDSQ